MIARCWRWVQVEISSYEWKINLSHLQTNAGLKYLSSCWNHLCILKKEVDQELSLVVISINKGLARVIKPGYTSFHHHTFYGSVYGPHALHKAALIHYLTNGTSFGNLSNPSDLQGRDNVRKVLEILKVVNVKYSNPNSIGGRFLGYSNGIIGRTVPAFAYFAVSAPMMQVFKLTPNIHVWSNFFTFNP